MCFEIESEALLTCSICYGEEDQPWHFPRHCYPHATLECEVFLQIEVSYFFVLFTSRDHIPDLPFHQTYFYTCQTQVDVVFCYD